MFRRKSLLFASLASALVLLAAGGYLSRSSDRESTDTSQASQVVVRGSIELTVTATGILQPRDFVDVGTQVTGALRVLHVDLGDRVEAGQLLAEIDPTVYLSRVEASQAMLTNQRAQLAEREARLILAERQFSRQRSMMADDATSTDEVQVAEANLLAARAQINAIKAQIEQTESELRGDEANLGYARIYAPIAGTVVSLAAKQGQTLNANQSTPIILRIADLSVMTVQAQVSEADVMRLKPGLPAYFTTLGDQQQRWHGRLDKILPTPEVLNSVVLFNALFDVPNEGGRLLTNMTAQVFFIIASAEDALLVPVAALKPASSPALVKDAERRSENARKGGDNRLPKGKSGTNQTAADPAKHVVRRAEVDVLGTNGQTETRQVLIGISNRVQAEVIEGLVEGDRVLVSARVTSGAPSSLRSDDGRGRGLRL